MKKHKTRKQKLVKKAKPKPQEKPKTIASLFGYKKGQWLWCQECGRCYQVGEERTQKDGFQYCHYTDCDGTLLVDASTWETVRHFKPEYPEIPEKNINYPLDVQLSGVWHS